MWTECAIIRDMKESLRPTVWRTARALANVNRLKFLRAVFAAKGTKGVSVLADELGLSVPTASVYLRALNARGLVDVKRESSHVYYGCGGDRSLPEAQSLQSAFARMFARKDLPDDWPSRAIPILQAYANERRIEIVKTLAANGPLTFTALLRLAGIPETSLLRHLSLLVEGGVVALDDKRQYCVAKPKDALRSTLLTMATGG